MSVKGVVLLGDRVVLGHNDRDEWELPGGRLEDRESPEECVVREIAEEVGISVRVDRILDTWVFEVVPGQRVLIVTFGCIATDSASIVASHEHDAIEAVPLSALDTLALPDGYRRSIRAWARMAHR